MKVSNMVSYLPRTKVKFGEENQKTVNYENPINRKTEKKLAALAAVGTSTVVGAIVGGLTSCIPAVKSIKVPAIAGVAAFGATLLLTLPSKLYHSAINAFVNEKEMDIFARDKALKANLTEEVHKEVLDSNISLDKKLDDNLKLQTANRAAAMFLHTTGNSQQNV